ncbi:hypothetical protein Taro_023887 [Colocasia esculenta]|uniref:Uncharacterized protein n=1 Tax=Colocasia esculenta TaxID=4460 RepID=A0A843V4X4_COLES|nr:hypothetical protein [Colocasia esculenta]
MSSSSPSCSLLLLALGIGVLLLLPPASALNRTATVHEVLPRYGLPPGLLPDAVASYSLGGDGRFVVELDRPSCYVQFGPFLVYYERHITGVLVMGSIRDLAGIQVQRRFLWVGVGEIKVDLPPTDSIYFQVGWITKRLSVEEFRTLHSCGGRASYKDRIFGIVRTTPYDPLPS